MTTVGRTGKHTQAAAPLFRLFTIPQLANLTPYRESYLEELASGRQPIRPRFRQVVSRILARSEADLFGREDADNQVTSGESDNSGLPKDSSIGQVA